MDRHDDPSWNKSSPSRARPPATGCLAVLSMCAVMLTGTLVPGVVCPVLRLDDGQLVSLSHVPSNFTYGNRVTVSGSGFGGSMSCQQEVLLVTKVEAAEGTD